MVFDLAAELEKDVETGACPTVIFDDNGNWAIVHEGFQAIRETDADDFNGVVFCKAEMFKPTLQEAWEDYKARGREEDAEKD